MWHLNFVGYRDDGVREIVEKYGSERSAYDNAQSNIITPDEKMQTRVFLSHKRSTGQGIAGRLFEGLKDAYDVFLDSVRLCCNIV